MGWDSAPELSRRSDAWFRWSRWTLKVSSSACTGMLVRNRWRWKSGCHCRFSAVIQRPAGQAMENQLCIALQ